MSIAISKEEFTLLGDLIRQECGITLQEDKKYLIESRLASLVAENGCQTYGEFYQKAKSNLGGRLKEKIVDAMTTNETLWFRDESPYRALKMFLFPQFSELMQKGQKAQLRIWSAACSTGQEPYSINIIANEFAQQQPQYSFLPNRTSILATDISPTALVLAQNGRYNGLAMSRGMLPGMQDKYFDSQGTIWSVKPQVRKNIEFQRFNLQQSFKPLGKFDIIFLRNVAIYFAPDFKKELFSKIAESLNPGGYLILGTSETLIGYSQDFQLIEKERCMFYQLKPRA